MKKHTSIVLGAVLSLGSISNAGAQWREKASGTENSLTAVSFPDARNGYICGAYNTMLKTADGGDTWQQLDTKQIPLMTFLSIDALDANKVFVARKGLYMTSDGGDSWTEWGKLSGSDGSIFSIKAVNDSTVFIMKLGRILKTSDRGSSWTECYAFKELAGPMIFTGNNDTAFAVSGRTWDNLSYGTIHRSVDGGKTWADLDLSSPQITAISFQSSSRGWYVDFERRLHRTTDGGTTWSYVSDLSPFGADYVTGLYFASDHAGYAISYKGTIFKTSDGGQSWTPDHIMSRNDANADLPLSMIAACGKGVIVVGNDGKIAKNDRSLDVPGNEMAELRLYPNPVVKQLTIELPANSAFRELSLLDMTGRRLQTISIAGQRTLKLNVEQYSKGAYLIEASGTGSRKAYPIVIQ